MIRDTIAIINRPRSATFFLLVGIMTLSCANSEDLSICINRDASFVGIPPLHYASVSGDTPLYIHKLYPVHCSPNDGSCTEKESLTSGDTVAIGKTCGPWTYAQHIGRARVTVGWVVSQRLKELPAKLPFDDGEPGGRVRDPGWSPPSTIHVKLIKGTGVPVCEAYLQRLNQSVFHEPPFCSIPENDQIPGFERLNRVPLNPATVNRLFVQAYNISHDTNANDEMRPPEPPKMGTLAIRWLRGRALFSIPTVSENDNLSAWAFDPLVDIENDDKPDNVVIWRDYPPIWHEELNNTCGVATTSGMGPASSDSAPFILTGDSKEIDLKKTIQVFDNSALRQLIVRNFPKGSVFGRRFIPLGESINIFLFNRKYYFSAYQEVDGKRSNPSASKAAVEHIAVYLHQAHQTRQICEYQNADGHGWNL